MKTIYRSELINKDFDTVKELEEAEAAYKAAKEKDLVAKEERKKAAKKVEDLYKEANEKLTEANNALKEFTKKYGSFHMTYTGEDVPKAPLFADIFDMFFSL